MEEWIMTASPRMLLALALVGATLFAPAGASPARAATTSRISLEIACQGSGVQGIAEGTISDPNDRPAAFRITCDPATPRRRIAITAVDDPEDMPWSVRVTVTNARGERTSCVERGTALPMQITCNAFGHAGRAI